MKHILKCSKCGNYTMKDVCGKCGANAVNPHPAKYSIEDKYGNYRRKMKKKLLEEAELK